MEVPGNVLNIVSDRAYPVKNIIEKIISLTNNSLGIDFRPLKNTPRSLQFDASKMRQYFDLPHTEIERGLLNELMYFKNLII